MQTYALYGSSGTGKSSSALELAHRLEADAIIDDGLLIYKGRKVAGTSAKYEKTRIQAVKRAIFFHEEHREEVMDAIRRLPVQKILVLATSIRMVERIVEALKLPPVQQFIPIEHVKPAEQIRAAQYVRDMMGRHAIPIPRVEVEKDFLHRLIASAQRIFSSRKEVIGETTVVHPPFSNGSIHISEHVLKKIIYHVCSRDPAVERVHKAVYSFTDLPRFQVTLSLRLPYLQDIRSTILPLQRELYQEMEFCLDTPPGSIDLIVANVTVMH
jgi:hypothetical protein